jgi:hypothetical protein
MIKRAVFARELGVPIVMHDYLTGGFTANTSCLIIAEIMAYFFTSTVQCTLLLIDRRIIVNKREREISTNAAFLLLINKRSSVRYSNGRHFGNVLRFFVFSLPFPLILLFSVVSLLLFRPIPVPLSP